ncbi:MAG: methylamine utilization protein [Hylemonella sp.]|uniref:methylamine utilization protein n=1 Tax=Hylemonella sp. TaxID=2066020 RepID=UPI0022BF98F1|nr:methylamine utilization protein [Hylemonella sp.]MCZ8253560.1 methylamine utilization protein [Hylemonella sp.]
MRGLSYLLGLVALACSGQALALNLEVRDDAGRPLAGAVLFLESAQARRQVRPVAQAEMGQAGKQFAPQVLVVPVGTAVSFPNRDTVRHHVYSFSATKKFELKLYIGTPANPVVFDRSGIAVLGCNIHDQMVGWIVVVETPYYAMSDAQGRAVIDAPPGSYRLRSWHPGLPVGAAAQDQALELAGPAQNVSVRLSGVQP